jgi:hypothetical protein
MLSNFFFLTYGGGQLSIDASTRALRAQQGTLFRIQHSSVDDVKGKGPVNVFAGRQKHKVQMEKKNQALVETIDGKATVKPQVKPLQE